MQEVQSLAKKKKAVVPLKNHLIPAAFSHFIVLITLADAVAILSVHKLYSVYLPPINTDSQTSSHCWTTGLVSFTVIHMHRCTPKACP